MICNKHFMSILLFLCVSVGVSYSKDYPIIFVHGHKDNPTDTSGWKTWDIPNSAMWKILNEHYSSYTAGDPFEL